MSEAARNIECRYPKACNVHGCPLMNEIALGGDPITADEFTVMAKDAERYREARKNPAGFNHLLSLMIKEQAEGRGDRAKALDTMMDRIIDSRKQAADAALMEKE